MATQLCELTVEMVKVNQPLKWDVFSAKGVLLLHKGFIVASENQLESLLDRGMYVNSVDLEKQKIEIRPQEYDPFQEWEILGKRANRLNLSCLSGSNDILGELNEITTGIVTLLEKNPDAAIFELIQMDLTNYVAAHNLQTAVLVALMAKRMNWNASDIGCLCRAAATMNIAILELQAVLSIQRVPITQAQREGLKNHGLQGRILLEKKGVTNDDWLRAVEQHHPEALPDNTTPTDMAKLIHHADVYLAKISPRAYRIAKPPNIAAKEILQGKDLSNAIAGIIIKEIGIYPPGSYVKLANGETAIVTKRGEQVHTPIAYSLVNASGMPLGEPVLRDTNAASFAVTNIVPKNKVMVTLNRARLFSKKKYTAFG